MYGGSRGMEFEYDGFLNLHLVDFFGHANVARFENVRGLDGQLLTVF